MKEANSCAIVFMMNYFAAQVKTLCEDHYISNVSKNLSHRKENQKFHFLKRKLKIKKRGKFICEVKPVFPGYIFIETKTIDADLYDIMRRTQGFYRFLKSNKDIVPLNEHDFFLIKHLLS
ncbi:MAG TPA: transcription termination/antitermination NusG family protein, partial [Treponemataceae bacterium]|nr:transcription termination/antitermination NusG family protein [Treponemataceae bacterium]